MKAAVAAVARAEVGTEYLCLHIRLVVAAPVESERLVNEERVVHGQNEQPLRGRQTLGFGSPDVQRYPCLGQEPQQPHPGLLQHTHSRV